jgi:uncharacterized cupredoxin-like copper-binding protein
LSRLAGKDAYVKAGFMGLGLYLVGLLTIFVAILIYDVAEIYFLLFFLVPGLIVAAALFFWRRWGLLVAIVGSLIGILFLSEDADLILTTPEAFFDFAATWFGIVGLLIVLVASIAGTVQYIRKQPAQTLAPWPSKLILGVAAVLAVAGVISLVAMIANTGSVSEAEAGDAPEVTAKHTKWSVEQITVPAGDVRLVVKNNDPLLHTFTLDDLDIDVTLSPWSEQVIVLEGVTAGNYGFICRVFDHESDMTGVITVQ